MYLYLHEDLVKAGMPQGDETAPMATVDGGAPVAPSAPAAPGDGAATMQPCSVGGKAGRCEELGGPPGGADNHEIGSQFEIEHTRGLAAEGAGAPQEETATPGDAATPEEAKDIVSDSAESRSRIAGNNTQGVTSINPEDYPEDTAPLDHYKVAAALEASGQGNDSSKELAEGHRSIARDRSEGLSPEEHDVLAQQLHEENLPEVAVYHEKTAGEGRAKVAEEEQQEFKDSVDPEFDALINKFDDQDKARELARQALKDYQAKLDPEDGEWSADNYEVHKEKKKSHEASMLAHKKKKPRKPTPFTDKQPDPEDFPESGAGFSAAQNAYGKDKSKAQDAQAQYKKDTHEWQQEDQDLKSEYDEYKAADKDFKEVENQRKEKVKEENAAKKTEEKNAAAASKAKAKDAQAVEDEKPQVPSSALEHAKVAGHREQATKAATNMKAWLEHLSTSDDMTNEEKDQVRAKINTVVQGLESHQNMQHIPSKDSEKELKELLKLAGEYGKKPPEEATLAEGAEGGSVKQGSAKKLDLLQTFESGRRFGASIGRAAATGEMAGVIGSEILSYGSKGVVSAGENLLSTKRSTSKDSSEEDRQTAATTVMMARNTAKQPKTLGEQEEARTRMTKKSLYLDMDADLALLKAVQTSSSATSPQSDKTAQSKLKSSYASQSTGVMGGAGVAMYDDPDVGRKWKHSKEDSVTEDIEEDRDEEKDEDVQKSMLTDSRVASAGLQMVRALNKSLGLELEVLRYNPRELEFMHKVLGASEGDISKGLVQIEGRNRHRFHEWLIVRMSTAIKVLGGQVG